jgi:aryl-alcohol dehydrogenase-like predicted oxidoreductase
MVYRALDFGINLVDTADIYSSGVSEEFVGMSLKGRRDRIVLATGLFWRPSFMERWAKAPSMSASRDSGFTERAKGGLRRLGTDHIDIYFVHRPDPGTAIEETLGALTDLIDRAKSAM